MFKYFKILIVLTLLVLGLYFMVKGDFMTGIASFLGLTGLGATALPKQPILEEKAAEVGKKVADIDNKLKDVKEKGVEDKSVQDEVDYWKNN